MIMKKHYVQAVLQLLAAGKDIDTVLASLHDMLQKKGHIKLHESILSAVLRELVRMEATQGALVTVAKESDAQKYRSAIQQTLSVLHTEADTVRTVVDPTLIGGFTAEYNNTRIDRSYKERLVSLYRSVTK